MKTKEVKKEKTELIDPVIIPFKDKTVQEIVTMAANAMFRLTEEAIAMKLSNILSGTNTDNKKIKSIKGLIADLEMGTVEYD